MADAPARTELKVTTGAIRGSRKIHVGDRKVAMREIDLEPGSGDPPLRVYDCSGPYTDPAAKIDIMAGLAELRRDWIRGRGDVEEVALPLRWALLRPPLAPGPNASAGQNVPDDVERICNHRGALR